MRNNALYVLACAVLLCAGALYWTAAQAQNTRRIERLVPQGQAGTPSSPQANNNPPANNTPSSGPALPAVYRVDGAPRAFGRVIVYPGHLGVIESKNVASVLHPAPGTFCIVLTPEVKAARASLTVATLDNDSTYTGQQYHQFFGLIETKNDVEDCGNKNAVEVLTFNVSIPVGTCRDQNNRPCDPGVYKHDYSFSFIIP